MQTILKILWILENEKILICGSGHGKPIDAKTAHKTLELMYTDAASLKDLEEITPHWARRTSYYAQDIMSELERTFTIIAGRLAYISHMLGELEEETEAIELDCLLDIQYMDELFVDFHVFARELNSDGENWVPAICYFYTHKSPINFFNLVHDLNQLRSSNVCA